MEKRLHVFDSPKSFIDVDFPVESAEPVGLFPTKFPSDDFDSALFHSDGYMLVAYLKSQNVTATASAAHAWDLTPKRGPGFFFVPGSPNRSIKACLMLESLAFAEWQRCTLISCRKRHFQSRFLRKAASMKRPIQTHVSNTLRPTAIPYEAIISQTMWVLSGVVSIFARSCSLSITPDSIILFPSQRTNPDCSKPGSTPRMGRFSLIARN